MRWRASALALLLALGPLASARAEAAPEEKADGYAEFRVGGCLLVDARRVCPGPGLKFKGEGEAVSFASIPLGYEVKAKGRRRAGGALEARDVEAKPNEDALFESEVISATNEAEEKYRRAGRFYEEGDRGRLENVGPIEEDGPRWERARDIVDSLLPPYLAPEDVRVYVIVNRDWNAFAMGNYALYVFSGLLDDMDDDEVAIVLGHELAHATHEHTRRQVKKQMWIQLVALGVLAAANSIDDDTKRAVVQLATGFTALAWGNGHGRNLEDQADRVGLRYAYEAGYDVTKGPRLWNRFARKYGEPGKVANFFFGDHSQSSARAAKLEQELAHNYPGGPKPDGVAQRQASAAARSSERRSAGGSAPAALPAGAAAVVTPRPASSSSPGGGARRGPAGEGEGAEVRPGMSADEVRSILGDPDEELVFGERTRWAYPDLTVVFEKGRVKEVKF